MAHCSLHLLLCFFFFLSSALTFSTSSSPTATSPAVADDPELVVQEVVRSINASVSRRRLGYLSCGTGNPIDDCWRCDPNWEKNRQRLADCAIGFGKNAIGGRNGKIYVVTDSGDDNPVTPKPGTLRYAVIQEEPLWIIFARDMVIQLKEELIMNSYKTLDGRGASVHIAGGPCITVQYVTNVIIHGLHIHDCKQGGNAYVRDSPGHYGWRTLSDGDGVSIFGGSHVWVDHCTLSNCRDGLIDAIHGSTAITISNNYLSHHDKVMLLGHSDTLMSDKNMQVTIAFNHFGEGLVQRMPRCRHGYFHVVNNDYTHWEMYAIGGSAAPTINSQGNRFLAPNDRFNKEVWSSILYFGGHLAAVLGLIIPARRAPPLLSVEALGLLHPVVICRHWPASTPDVTVRRLCWLPASGCMGYLYVLDLGSLTLFCLHVSWLLIAMPCRIQPCFSRLFGALPLVTLLLLTAVILPFSE